MMYNTVKMKHKTKNKISNMTYLNREKYDSSVQKCITPVIDCCVHIVGSWTTLQ